MLNQMMKDDLWPFIIFEVFGLAPWSVRRGLCGVHFWEI